MNWEARYIIRRLLAVYCSMSYNESILDKQLELGCGYDEV